MAGPCFCANAGDPGPHFWQDRPSVMLYIFSINGQGAIHDR